MIVEMPLSKRDVDIARLADWLAIVEGFENCKEATVFLQRSRQSIKVARARMIAEP